MPAGQVSNHTNMITLIKLTLKLGGVANEMCVLGEPLYLSPFIWETCLTDCRSVLRKSQRNQQHDCIERLLSLRKSLIDWWSTLPEETSCRDLNPGPLFRSNVHLKLDYCLTRIFLGRPFLFSSMRAISVSSSQGPPFKTPSGLAKNRSNLVTDCVEAALEIINLCQLLRDETGLARASFTEFSSCRAALLVILAQSLTKRTERLREGLRKGMALIKIMSMGVGSARSAVSVIEALERAIHRLEEYSETHSSGNPGTVESAYDRFKNWEMLWKTGPISPESVPFQDQQPYPTGPATAGSAGIPAAIPITPITGSSGGADSMEGEIARSDLTGTTAYSTTAHHGANLSEMPAFGFDQYVSNLPQELGEFTAIPCFETDPNHGPNTDARWIQFMTE